MTFIDSNHLLTQQRIARQGQISAEMARVAMSSEASLPDQRQVIAVDVQADQIYFLAHSRQIEHTAGPTWQQRAQIAAVLVVGLPVAIGAAFAAARTITALAEWAGALLA
jgi:hypothetical protein